LHQTLPEIFQPDLERKILSRLCLKKFNRTLPENFQSTPQPLLESCVPINQTLPKIFQPDFD